VTERQDIERINEASLSLLADPGVRLEHDGICELLIRRGARCGTDANVVRFPRELVADGLAAAPKVVRLASLDGALTEMSAGSGALFWTGAALNWVCPDGRCRQINSGDLADFARLIDSLDTVHGVVGTAMADVPPRARDFVGLRVLAENCRRHLRALSFTPTGAEAMRRMAAVLCGGESLKERPVFSMGFTAHGPLRWTNLALEIFRQSAGDGIPVMVNGEPMAGASAPVTLAGALAVGHAEILAGIIVNQVLEPGRPVIHNLGFAHILDMRTASAVTAGAETCLLAAAGAALARLHDLPSASWMCTDAMAPDEQASAETMMAALSHAAAGVSLIWGVGQLESQKTISPVKAVMDDEIIGMVRRHLRGVEVTDESLVEDLIRRVGVGGEFLGTDHTLAHFHDEFYEPKLLCRVSRERWENEGRRELVDRARERAAELLSADRPPLLDEGVSKELRSIEKRYLEKLR